MSDSLRAYLALLIGVLCIGFSAIFVSWANAPGAVTGFYRMAVALVILAYPFYRRVQRRHHLHHSSGAAGSPGLPKGELLIALVGGLFFAGDLIFWNTAILFSGATNPTLMGNTAPL